MATDYDVSDHNMRSYRETYAEFRLDCQDYYNFGYDVIDSFAQDSELEMMRWAGDDADDKRLTYAHFRDRSNQFVNAVKSIGLKKNDHVMIVMSRIPQWWESMIGMIKAGIIAVPGATQLTEKDIKYRLEAGQIKCVITDADNAYKFDEAKKDFSDLSALIIVDGDRKGWLNYETLLSGFGKIVDPSDKVLTHRDDPMLLYFTSGTTGQPKMALHMHSYAHAHTVTGKFWLDLRKGDLHWYLSDTGWGKAAWSSLFGPLGTGATIYVHNTKEKYRANLTLDLLSRNNITSFCAPPTAYRLLIMEDLAKYDLSSLRSCVAAGEPLNSEVIETWRKRTGITIRDGYGQTETVLIVGNFPVSDAPVKPGSMGKCAPGFVVEVVDGCGVPVAPDQEGDIAVMVKPNRPLGLFKEYWGNPLATNSTYRGQWYITGDRAIRDEDGYFWFVGRADDLIISSGYRIGPFEVESALIEHPAVLESAVIAQPDMVRGEIVKAFVVLRPEYQPSEELAQELQDFVKHLTAPYKYPREIEFTSELPKTISGKIRRIELRQKH